MCWYEQLDEKVREYLPDMTMEREVPLSKHTSFRIGGPARRLAFPANREQLGILMGLAESCGVKPFLLGRGTNLLVDDRGLDTLVIKTAEHMTAVRQLDEVTLEADAGILLNHLAVYAQQHGLSGLEFAHGIPGTLGGAICMNAGAYGGEMRQVVTEVTALLPEGVRRFTAEEAAFGYRRSAFLDTEAVVLGAKLRLTPDDPAAIRRRMDDLMARRRQSQPLEYPSAGSTFKRPEGYRDTHRTDGPEGPDGGRSAGFHQARRLCHQRGRRYQRRRGGADPAGAAGGVRRPRRAFGAGGADRPLRKERAWKF